MFVRNPTVIRRLPISIAIVALLLNSQAPAALSAWDETQLQLLGQYSVPLRWYNVEGPPSWVAGPKLRHQLGGQPTLIRLGPGEETTLSAGANTWLRLVGKNKTLNPEALQASISIDARVFTSATPIQTADPYSLLIPLPQGQPSLIRLTRSRTGASELAFAAYFSVEEPFKTLAPYRDLVHLPGKVVRVRRDDEAVSEPAWLIQPEEGSELSVQGPARLQLVARLPWAGTELLHEQSLVVQLRLDDAAPEPLIFSPELDARHRTRVKSSAKLVSRRMEGFLNVPAGKHRLRLEPAVPVYLSIYAQAKTQFLLPWLNAPATNAFDVLQSALPPGAAHSVIRFGPPDMPLDPREFASQEQASWRLALDNLQLDAGGQAADWLNRLAQTRRDYPPARLTAAELRRHRAFYREILPSRLEPGQSLTPRLFSPMRLMEPFAPERPVVAANPTIEQLRGLLADGDFVPVPHVLAPALLYQLPPRSFETKLRIAVLPSQRERTQLFVQFDQASPVKMMIDAQKALPAEGLEPSPAFATLRALEQQAQLPAHLTFGTPVGEFDLPRPVGEPGVVELPLPQGVRRIRLYQESPATPVAASVAYGAAKPFDFGESSYVSLLGQKATKDAWRLITNSREAASNAPEPVRQLSNHLQPLVRLLRAHYSDFTNSISLAVSSHESSQLLSAEAALKFQETAGSLERAGQPIEAIEVWNRIFWEGAKEQRGHAALSLMRLLQALGEDFLATQFARCALLEARAPEFPAAAVALLEDNSRQTENTEQLEQLRAFLFLRCPCPKHLGGLVEAFALNSRHELVLSAGLLLPPEQRPEDWMLAAALQQNWWQTFDRLAADLRPDEAKCLWRAQKSLAFYRFVDAERELQQAGEKGAAVLRVLREGMEIRQRLGAADLSERLKALFAWEQWQARQPGPRIWQTSEELVYQCAGSELAFNSERNDFTTFFRAERGKPARLRFLGPARLQIEARPVLDLPFAKPVDDWLEISEHGLTNRIPICQAIPNPGLGFATRSNALIGVKTTANLQWGPGLHEVEVGLVGRTGLIRVLMEKPVMPLRILPTLNLDRLNLVLQENRQNLPTQRPKHVSSEGGNWWVPAKLARRTPGTPTPGAERASGVAPHAVPEQKSLTDVELLRLALRLPGEPEQQPPSRFEQLQALPPMEQWLAACRWRQWNVFTNWLELSEAQLASYHLATHQIRELLDQATPHDLLQRLVTLLQVAEYFPRFREEAQLQAELITTNTNCPPGCARLMVRLSQNLAWIPLPVTPLSAGLRPLPVASDLPQDPAVRMRRALLPPAGTNQFTIGGQSEFAASMNLQHSANVRLSAELARAGFAPLAPLTVSLQIDGLNPQHLQLIPTKTQAGVDFRLTEGPHLIRAWIEDPAVNQFVRFTLAGQTASPTNSIWTQSMAEASSGNRFYHGATAAQPLRFSWTGPALLRVDEWREGRLLSQLRMVPRGEQTIEIQPAPGRPESWYRVFVRATQTNQPDVRASWAVREPEEMLPPRLRLPESVAPSSAQLTDYYALGGQEDGTWTASALAAHRWPFEPGGKKNAALNEFVQATAAHEKLNERATIWSETEALARVHRTGDLTFGLSERLEGHPQVELFDWSWEGTAFAGSLGNQHRDVEGALYTALEFGQHRHLTRRIDYYPFASLFARYLSLSANNASQYSYIDQDLFTKFRSTHRWGGAAGNQLDYQPWLDTVLRGYIGVTGNEDLTPDQWGMRFSWNQLMGPVRAEVTYELRQFLKDTERSSSSWIQGVAGGLYAECWLDGRHRLELGGQYRHDWPGTGSSYFVVLRWDFSHGRGYQDHGPREIAFRDLRSRRIPSAYNNLFQTGPPGGTLP